MKIEGSTGIATITDVDGNSQSAVVAFDGMIYLVATIDYSYWSNLYVCTDGYCPAAEVATLTDPNGNSMSSTITNLGNLYQQAFTDSLGQPALTVTGYPAGGGSNTTLTWPNAGQGGGSPTSQATVNTEWVLIGTNWTGCSGQPKENQMVQMVPTSVSFADSSSLYIGWEEATGISWDGHPYSTGRISSVGIPSGATIAYAYSGGTDSVNCSDGTPNTMTRTTPDGIWTYVHTPGTSPNSTTTVTDPVGNQSVFTFSGQYQTLLKVYAGAASGSAMKTVQTCYNNNCSSAATPPFTQIDTYVTLAGQSTPTRTTTFYDGTYGVLTEIDEYSNSSSLVRKTLIAYGTWNGTSCSTIGNNIHSAVCKKEVYSGSQLASRSVYIYDSKGNLTSQKLWNGSTYLTTAAYTINPSNGTPATVTSPLGLVTTLGYSCNAGLLSSMSTNLPSGLSTSSVIDCNGALPTSVTDANSQITSISYGSDPFYRQVSTTDALQNTTTHGYGAGGVSVTTTYPTSAGATNTTAVYTDTLGRTNNSHVQDGSSYDTNSIYREWFGGGFLTKATLPCSSSEGVLCSGFSAGTSTVYDPLGRTSSSTTESCRDRGGCTVYSSTTYSYYPATTVSGNNVIDVLVSTNGASKNFEYDALGRLTSVCEVSTQAGSGLCGQAPAATGFLTTYTNNIFGQILVVNQGAQTRTFQYDMLSRLISEANPENGATNYVYDTATAACTTGYPGKLVQKTDANGNTVCLNYDLLGRMTSTTYSGPNAGPRKYFVYDAATYVGSAMTYAKGHLAEAYTCTTCPGTKITDEFFSYDARGTLTDVWERTPNSLNYYHTTVGHFPNYSIASLAGPGSLASVAYTLDSKGRPYSATANGGTMNLVNSTTYNVADRPITVNSGLGDTDAFVYDSGYRPTNFTYTVGSAGTNVAGTLAYDPVEGTLASLQITDGFNGAATETCYYGYDDMLRLNNDSCGSAWYQTFSYDRYGNITKSGSLTFSPGYTPSTNRYSGLLHATYDSNGNLTNDGINGYTFDAENEVVTVTTGSGTATVTRDALGRIVEVDQPSGVIREIVYNATGKRAILAGPFTVEDDFAALPGGGELEALNGGSGGYLFHHKDWLGTSRLISNLGSQTMYFDSAYAPFGENYAPSGITDLNFTDQTQNVVTGIYDFQYREYNPNHGRWLSADPAGRDAVDPTDPQSWNRYSYVLNAPLNRTDPLGLAPPEGSYRIEGVEIPSYIFHDLVGDNLSGAVVNCYPYCDLVTSGKLKIGPDNRLYTYVVPIYGMDCSNSGCGGMYLKRPGGWSVVGSVSDYTDSNSWAWDFTKSFFTGFSLRAIYDSFKDPNGCDRLLATTFAGDFNPLPDDSISASDAAELAPKVVGAAGLANAGLYSASRGLVVPLRSGVVRGLRAEALEASVAVEEAAPYVQVAGAGAHALYAAGSAAYNGECH